MEIPRVWQELHPLKNVDIFKKSQLEKFYNFKIKEIALSDLNDEIKKDDLVTFILDTQIQEDWIFYPFLLSYFKITDDHNFVPMFNEHFPYRLLDKKALWTFVIIKNIWMKFGKEIKCRTYSNMKSLKHFSSDIYIEIENTKILIDIFEKDDTRKEEFRKNTTISKDISYACLDLSFLTYDSISGFVPDEKIHKLLKNSKHITNFLKKIFFIIKRKNSPNCNIF